MKTLILSHTDVHGGAARAAYRLLEALRDNDVDSQMLVRVKYSDSKHVIGPDGIIQKTVNKVRPRIGNCINKLQRTTNPHLHSGNWLPSQLSNRINTSEIDVLNMHWVAGETISIEDIGRIKKPLVWTLHDMWPFCGGEHIANVGADARWRRSYESDNRISGDSGIDLNRIIWRRKFKNWKNPIQIVAPSEWMADCAKNSALFHNWPICVIPNALPTQKYKPLDPEFCRSALNFQPNKKIILFGAFGGGRDQLKGCDLLMNALNIMAKENDPNDYLCVVFGQSEPEESLRYPMEMRWMGHLHDDYTISMLYNAATVMVVPSRLENLPQTATEAQACGCPVVAFNTGGLKDAVVHEKTGYLANPFDERDLAFGISWILGDNRIRESLSLAARQRAVQLWSEDVIAKSYKDIFELVSSQFAPRS